MRYNAYEFALFLSSAILSASFVFCLTVCLLSSDFCFLYLYTLLVWFNTFNISVFPSVISKFSIFLPHFHSSIQYIQSPAGPLLACLLTLPGNLKSLTPCFYCLK